MAIHVSPGVLSIPKGVCVSPRVLEVLVSVQRSLQVTVLLKGITTVPMAVRLSPQVLSIPVSPQVLGVPVSMHLWVPRVPKSTYESVGIPGLPPQVPSWMSPRDP